MKVRNLSAGFTLTFGLSCLVSMGAVQAAQRTQTPGAIPIVPILGISRQSSADRAFLFKASALAISTMKASSSEMAITRLANAQGEAVRAFNTAAAAYNSLADIASEHGLNVATPSSIFLPNDNPTPLDGAPVEPRDIAYFNSRQLSLLKTIAIYNAEARHGTDPVTVAFAMQMKSRLEHDLALTTIGVQRLDSGGYGDRPAVATAAASPTP